MADPKPDAGTTDTDRATTGHRATDDKGLPGTGKVLLVAPQAGPRQSNPIEDLLQVEAEPSSRLDEASSVVLRTFKTSSGAWLHGELQRLLRPAGKAPTRLRVSFASTPGEEHEGAVGAFEPQERTASEYRIAVTWEKDSQPNDMWTDLPGGIALFGKLGLTKMATTLFHELLHVWYVRTHDSGTGHGSLDKKTNLYLEAKSDFMRHYRSAVRELDQLEQLDAKR